MLLVKHIHTAKNHHLFHLHTQKKVVAQPFSAQTRDSVEVNTQIYDFRLIDRTEKTRGLVADL